MSAIKIILTIIILYLIYKSFNKSSFIPIPTRRWSPPTKKPSEKKVNWNDKLITEELSPEDIARHKKDMTSQAPMFSTGAGYSIVEEDSTNPAFSQFYGLNRPSYVPILPNQRQITDIDVARFKNNKRLNWN